MIGACASLAGVVAIVDFSTDLVEDELSFNGVFVVATAGSTFTSTASIFMERRAFLDGVFSTTGDGLLPLSLVFSAFALGERGDRMLEFVFDSLEGVSTFNCVVS